MLSLVYTVLPGKHAYRDLGAISADGYFASLEDFSPLIPRQAGSMVGCSARQGLDTAPG
jgi:hypothetical protein